MEGLWLDGEGCCCCSGGGGPQQRVEAPRAAAAEQRSGGSARSAVLLGLSPPLAARVSLRRGPACVRCYPRGRIRIEDPDTMAGSRHCLGAGSRRGWAGNKWLCCKRPAVPAAAAAALVQRAAVHPTPYSCAPRAKSKYNTHLARRCGRLHDRPGHHRAAPGDGLGPAAALHLHLLLPHHPGLPALQAGLMDAARRQHGCAETTQGGSKGLQLNTVQVLLMSWGFLAAMLLFDQASAYGLCATGARVLSGRTQLLGFERQNSHSWARVLCGAVGGH